LTNFHPGWSRFIWKRRDQKTSLPAARFIPWNSRWTWISQVHRTHIKKWIAVGFCFCCYCFCCCCCCCCCRCLLLFLRGRHFWRFFIWFPVSGGIPMDHGKFFLPGR
jgi:hypothetical protein